MIARISNGASFYGILAYNNIKVEGGKGEITACNNMPYSRCIMERGELPLCLPTFEQYAALNTRTRKPVFHASLNPHPDDPVGSDKLAELAQEYMDRMGYGDQPYIVYRHDDIDRTHAHIVSVRVDAGGRKIDHNNEGQRSEKITEDMEREYGLTPAKGSGQDKALDETPEKVVYERGDVKRQVSSVVRYAIQNYKFSSPGKLNTLLNLFNVSVDQVEGTVRDVSYKGIVYQTMQNGETVGKPFKSSIIGKDVDFEALHKDPKFLAAILLAQLRIGKFDRRRF